MTVLLLLACTPSEPEIAPPPRGDALYFALVDRFADGAPDAPGSTDDSDLQAWHGGDLAGLIDKVPWLAEQGYGALWISPVTKTRTEPIGEWGAYHGYWMLEPDAVEPRFGTEAELVQLSEALHARDMRLYLDVVVNHVGYDAPLSKTHPDWFHANGDIQDWNDPQQVVEYDVHGLHDLAQEKPEVADWLAKAGLHWIETVKPDGFRIDAVRHVPPGFLADYGDQMRKASTREGFQILGEVFDGNPGNLAERARSDRLDSQFDFPLMYGIQQSAPCVDADYGRLATNLFTERHLPAASDGPLLPLVTLLDNHDVPRIASQCHDVGAALGLLFGARGTPSVTWGTAAGLNGAHEPENRADMPWDATMPLAPTLQKLNTLRGRWPALREGGQAVAALSDAGIVLQRWTPEQTVYVVHHRVAGAFPHALTEGWVFTQNTVVPYEGEPFEGTLVGLAKNHTPFDDSAKTVTVEVPDVPLKPGESLFVVGSAPELGGWKASGAVPVKSRSARFTMPGGTATAAKLVAVGPDGERWSNASDVAVLAGGTARVEWKD